MADPTYKNKPAYRLLPSGEVEYLGLALEVLLPEDIWEGKNRRIGHTRFDDGSVISTVFTVVPFKEDKATKQPLLFETALFEKVGGEMEAQYFRYYATLKEAIAGHTEEALKRGRTHKIHEAWKVEPTSVWDRLLKD